MRHPGADLLRRGDRPLPPLEPSALSADSRSPAHRELAGLSRCLLAGTLVFAISAFFFHMAYSPYLPPLAGFTVALQLARLAILYCDLGLTELRSLAIGIRCTILVSTSHGSRLGASSHV